MSVTQGSSTFGSSGYTLVSSRPVYDQANGYTWEVEYHGLPAYIASLASSLQSQGARTTTENREGVGVLVAHWVRDPDQAASAEVPFDTWSITSEEASQSLFADPAAIAEAKRYGSGYKSDIEQCVTNAEFTLVNPSSYPIARAIFELLLQGVDSAPRRSPFLRRNRTYSLTYTGTPYRVNSKGIVYTRASLLSEFGIVDPLASRIPLDPTDELTDGFVYGWYLAEEEFRYSRERGAMKVEETLGFRFGVYNAAATGAIYELR